MDPLFKKIINAPNEHSSLELIDGLLWRQNLIDKKVLCIPRVKLGKRALVAIIIDHAHTAIGHFGPQKTSDYIRRWYWWPSLGKDVLAFCGSCGLCQTTKTPNQRPMGLLHSLPTPHRPWSSIAMDFLGPFPKVDQFDYLWVVLCRLTSLPTAVFHFSFRQVLPLPTFI